jgi:hypothetical protein
MLFGEAPSVNLVCLHSRMGDMHVKSGAPGALQQRAVAIKQAMVFMESATSKKIFKK